MCGIVHRPTRSKDFTPNQFLHLSQETVLKIVILCEDVRIPNLATNLVLSFANNMAYQNFVMQSIPFALYEDGKRLVTKETVQVEEAIIHLAMAGSVRHYINNEIAQYGLTLEMGHCCDIQMHALRFKKDALRLSHDANVYRADKLRNMYGDDTLCIPHDKFLQKIGDTKTHLLTADMFALVLQQDALLP